MHYLYTYVLYKYAYCKSYAVKCVHLPCKSWTVILSFTRVIYRQGLGFILGIKFGLDFSDRNAVSRSAKHIDLGMCLTL